MKYEKITYTDPASVRRIMDANGSGMGILNTDTGLWIADHRKTYPKGSVFYVSKSRIVPAMLSPFDGQPMPLIQGIETLFKNGQKFRVRVEYFYCPTAGRFQTGRQVDEQLARLSAAYARWEKKQTTL